MNKNEYNIDLHSFNVCLAAFIGLFPLTMKEKQLYGTMKFNMYCTVRIQCLTICINVAVGSICQKLTLFIKSYYKYTYDIVCVKR